MLRCFVSLLLLLPAACQTRTDVAPPAEDLCTLLLQAEPQDWPRYVPGILNEASAAEHLLAALEEDPEAPGAQAALALLGVLGDPAAGPPLEDWVRRRDLYADEAALSLGRLPYPASAELLCSTARDPDANPTLRTACACAALELGHGAEVLDVLRAVLLAGTPAGQERELGFPIRSRWALERHMIVLTCRRAGYDLGIDTDSPWPRMVDGIETLNRLLREGGR